MRPSVRFCVLGLAVSLALVAASSPAVAAPKRITGKLSKPGYTVIALAADGQAKVVRARRGRFTLRPPAGRVTLHLRAPDGTYAGPIVVGSERRGRRAIVGVRAGARLGSVRVRRGYARPSRRLRGRWVDAGPVARARGGVPIGAGNFGRVRSKPPRGSPRADRDLDGIPDPLDVDDDGDLILDNFERSRRARTAQAENAFGLHARMGGDLHETVNANPRDSLGAPAFMDAQIEAALPRFGALSVEILSGDSAELDCGGANQLPPRPEGLIYCSRRGTGRMFRDDTIPFPDCCDPDSDGFGTLTRSPNSGLPFLVFRHGATTAQIGTGDVLIEHVATGVPESKCPSPRPSCASFTATLQFVFATSPALVSYSDGQGSSATVSYPVPGPDPATGICPMGPPPCSGPGTRENPFAVKAGPGGDIVLTLTFWRPQRRPIPGETCVLQTPPCQWVDIGGLAYTAGIADIGFYCPQSAFSEADPSLTLPSFPPFAGGGGFTDSAKDQPASADNKFTYAVNATQCLASKGLSWNPGEERGFGFLASTNSGDSTQQNVFFKRQ